MANFLIYDFWTMFLNNLNYLREAKLSRFLPLEPPLIFEISSYVCSDGTWYDVTTGVPGNMGYKDPNPPAKEKRREGPPDPSTDPLSPHHN
jgi:hypothetical protein